MFNAQSCLPLSHDALIFDLLQSHLVCLFALELLLHPKFALCGPCFELLLNLLAQHLDLGARTRELCGVANVSYLWK